MQRKSFAVTEVPIFFVTEAVGWWMNFFPKKICKAARILLNSHRKKGISTLHA